MFLSLCISEFSSHEFLDKYDYPKSNNEIAKKIMQNFILSIPENNKHRKKNFLIFYLKRYIGKLLKMNHKKKLLMFEMK